MTKIDISKVREGDMVQVMHGNWTRVADIDAQTREDGQGWFRVDESLAPIHTDYLTGHKPAASPEPVAEWVDGETVKYLIDQAEYAPGEFHEALETVLRHEYGPPPIIKTATGEEEGRRVLTKDVLTGKWFEGDARYLEPGDRYVELPKCCREGV